MTGISTSLPPQGLAVSRQEMRVEHMITDDELTRIETEQRNIPSEFCLIGVGGVISGLAPAIVAFCKFNGDDFGLEDLVIICTFIVCIAIAALAGYLWHKSAGNCSDIIREIRNRKLEEIPSPGQSNTMTDNPTPANQTSLMS